MNPFSTPFDYSQMVDPPKHAPGVLSIHRVLNLATYGCDVTVERARFEAIVKQARAEADARIERRDQEAAEEEAQRNAVKAHGTGISITIQGEGRRHWWRVKNHKKTHGE